MRVVDSLSSWQEEEVVSGVKKTTKRRFVHSSLNGAKEFLMMYTYPEYSLNMRASAPSMSSAGIPLAAAVSGVARDVISNPPGPLAPAAPSSPVEPMEAISVLIKSAKGLFSPSKSGSVDDLVEPERVEPDGPMGLEEWFDEEEDRDGESGAAGGRVEEDAEPEVEVVVGNRRTGGGGGTGCSSKYDAMMIQKVMEIGKCGFSTNIFFFHILPRHDIYT